MSDRDPNIVNSRSSRFVTVRDTDGPCHISSDNECPICTGQLSDECVAKIVDAASKPGKPMAAEKFFKWLDSRKRLNLK